LDLAEYYEAFAHLTTSRQVVMGGIGGIPVSQVESYLNLRGIKDIDERLTFLKLVTALDVVYLEHHRETYKQQQESSKKTVEEAKAKKGKVKWPV